ncbi:hypothetical protein T06_15607 [Trichinella sp. T6]|nr:hypothetical protein T06_15607 [Trichinella sp. T6]
MHALNPQDENSNVDTKLLRITIICRHLCLKKLKENFCRLVGATVARLTPDQKIIFHLDGKMDGTSATSTTTSVLF